MCANDDLELNSCGLYLEMCIELADSCSLNDQLTSGSPWQAPTVYGALRGLEVYLSSTRFSVYLLQHRIYLLTISVQYALSMVILSGY